MPWAWGKGYKKEDAPTFRGFTVGIDYGVKRNILRLLAGMGGEDITVVPANASTEEAHGVSKPHGVLLSNGPGDPAATGVYAIPAHQGRD